MPRNIIWIASYPKSGNTWLRAFLANYLLDRPDGEPLPLDQLSRMSHNDASSRAIGRIAGRDVTGLTPAGLWQARHAYLEEIANRPEPSFIKTHVARAEIGGIGLIPPDLTRSAVYIVRNPLDLAISFASHMSLSLEASAEALGDANQVLKMSDGQILQFIGDWSMHVRSWFSAEGFPVQVLRYEDMLDDPEKSFLSVLELIEAPVDRGRLLSAIDASSFRTLSGQEDRAGFDETIEGQDKFFARGTKGHWKDVLPPDIADRITARHSTVMKVLKYL